MEKLIVCLFFGVVGIALIWSGFREKSNKKKDPDKMTPPYDARRIKSDYMTDDKSTTKFQANIPVHETEPKSYVTCYLYKIAGVYKYYSRQNRNWVDVPEDYTLDEGSFRVYCNEKEARFKTEKNLPAFDTSNAKKLECANRIRVTNDSYHDTNVFTFNIIEKISPPMATRIKDKNGDMKYNERIYHFETLTYTVTINENKEITKIFLNVHFRESESCSSCFMWETLLTDTVTNPILKSKLDGYIKDIKEMIDLFTKI